MYWQSVADQVHVCPPQGDDHAAGIRSEQAAVAKVLLPLTKAHLDTNTSSPLQTLVPTCAGVHCDG